MAKEKSEKSSTKLAALLWLWKCRAALASNAHFHAADFYRKRHNFLTITNVFSAIMVLFLGNNEIFRHDLQSYVSLAGAATVVTTTLQYILAYREASKDHKRIANEYSNIKRKAERLIVTGDFDEGTIHRMSNALNWLGKGSPAVKRALWNDAEQKIPQGINDVSVAEKRLIEELAEFGMTFDDFPSKM